jgi:hypothetical protein
VEDPNKMAAITAAEVCRNFELSKEGQKLLQPQLMPRPFLDLLIANQHYQDAARLMAHALPRREAIWWGCLCARKAYGPAPPAREGAALQLAETWVVRPTDENRRAAYKAAEAAEFRNPAGLLGMAVFFSSGSLAPAGQAEVAPAPHLAPNAAANAVVLASLLQDPAKASEQYLSFFALGFDVASGKNRWK